MLKSALTLAACLAGVPAYATSFTCKGAVQNYGFTFTGAISGSRVSGQARMVVTKDGAVYRQGSAPVLASEFINGTSFSIETKDSYSHITFWAQYMDGGFYQGVMSINSDQGNTDVSTRCTIQ